MATQNDKIITSVTTTDGAAKALFSVPIEEETSFKIEVEINDAKTTNLSNSCSGKYMTQGRRALGNNVAVSATGSSEVRGNFLLGQPSISFTYNTNTNAVDIKATGKDGATIEWELEIKISRS